MKIFKTIFSLILLISFFNCGKNEPEKKVTSKKQRNISQKARVILPPKSSDTTYIDSAATENSDDFLNLNPTKTNLNSQTNAPLASKGADKKNKNNTSSTTNAKQAEQIINSPLRNLLKNAEKGKSYSQKELIENYKFPKEAVDLIKKVTCVGPNQLYFNWGSTWFVEKVSDAEFKNDTLIFKFKQNKTYISGGAIGIKYNKKIHTDLILNNGSAYIPTVKGYHWEIGK